MTVPRTVRLTDRRPGEGQPGEAPERVVGGFRIERGVPVPPRRALKQVLAALAVGESFVHTGNGTWSRRLFKDRKFTARKLAHNRYRIWRIQ